MLVAIIALLVVFLVAAVVVLAAWFGTRAHKPKSRGFVKVFETMSDHLNGDVEPAVFTTLAHALR